MRKGVLFLGMMVLLALSAPASAQFSGMFGTKTTGKSIPSNTPAFFTGGMTRPDFSAMSMRPQMAPPLNIGSMLPSFSHLRDTLMLRNIFTGPQVTVQVPPPPKKTP